MLNVYIKIRKEYTKVKVYIYIYINLAVKFQHHIKKKNKALYLVHTIKSLKYRAAYELTKTVFFKFYLIKI